MNKKGQFGAIGVLFVCIIMVLVIGAMLCVRVVPAGHVGVYDLFGDVGDREMPVGLKIKNPFASIYNMDVRTQEYTMTFISEEGAVKGKADVIEVLTKEGLSIDLDLTILYRVKPEQASIIYRTIGTNYVEKIVRPQIRSVIREVVANYETNAIYSEKRGEVRDEIYVKLKSKLLERGIILEDVLLRNVRLPDAVRTAIELKSSFEHKIGQKQFEVETEKLEAERKRVEAQGIADANYIIADSLTTNYLTWWWIQNLDKHDSVLYVPVGQGGMPIFKEVGSP